ncbi:MAG: cytochrome b/b6 domain-containing protein [Rubrivivax sp.]|jgi:cytochrome b
MHTPTTSTSPVRVWDLPTRLFHWALAAAVVGLVVTGKVGGNAMQWHFWLGYTVLGLLVFRLVWGLVGGRWSRFASFIYAPGTVLRYLRGQPRPGEHLDVGHNPLGAFSVFALLGLLAVQVGTGLISDDEIANQGPLNRFVASETGISATHWHKDLGQYLLLALVALHIAAILFYLLKHRQNLVRPMLTGDKALPADTPASADNTRTRALALVLAVAITFGVRWLVGLGAPVA